MMDNVKCSFCGYEFSIEEGRTACNGCPMSKACNKHKCPNCSFEILKEPKLISLIKEWGKKSGSK